jgi:hypothetical protein
MYLGIAMAVLVLWNDPFRRTEKVTEIIEGGEIFYGNGSSGMGTDEGFNNLLRYRLVIGDLSY